mmetsp:Transcript_128204/g.256047  ORF Transcript_128204/g.256047 Transcript_128204/m.256047 type:complete len:471 (+) Transcript_128204:3-1415(+)
MMYPSVQRHPILDMATHCGHRQQSYKAQVMWLVALCCLEDAGGATSIPEAVPAGRCRASSSMVRARSLESWLPHAAWLGLTKDVAASYSSHRCEMESASLLQKKKARTIRQVHLPTLLLQKSELEMQSHETKPSGKQRLVKNSSRMKHTANLTHPPVMAAHPLLVGSSVAAKQHSKTKSAAAPTVVLPASLILIMKALCIFSNMLTQLSPIPQVRQFHKIKDTGEVDAAPYVSIMFGGMQWSFYGMFAFAVTRNADVMVLVYSNMAGAILGIYYVHGFFANCKDTSLRQRLRMYCKLTATLAAVQLLVTMLLDPHHALLFFGLVSCISGMMGACSLLTTMPQVFYSRCSSSINLPLVCTGIFGSSIWLICGLMMHDVWIITPNCVALCLQSCAAAVVVIFPRELDKPPINSKSKSTGQKMAVKDTSASEAAPPCASHMSQPLQQGQLATSGEAPDYGTMQRQPGGTGSTF